MAKRWFSNSILSSVMYCLKLSQMLFFVTDHYRAYRLVLVNLGKASLEHIEILLRRA